MQTITHSDVNNARKRRNVPLSSVITLSQEAWFDATHSYQMTRDNSNISSLLYDRNLMIARARALRGIEVKYLFGKGVVGCSFFAHESTF